MIDSPVGGGAILIKGKGGIIGSGTYTEVG